MFIDSHYFSQFACMGKESLEDRYLIKALRTEKHWGATRIMQFLPNKPWESRILNKIIAKIDATGNVLRKSGSGRPRTSRTPNTINTVKQLICSPANLPGSHRTPREIER